MTSTPSKPSPERSSASADAPAAAPEAEATGARSPDLPGSRLAALCALALVLVAGLGRIDPFGALSSWLTGGDALLQTPLEDHDSWDPGRGATLLATTKKLAPLAPGMQRVLVFGNSQQYTVSLPRGAAIDPKERVVIASARLGKTLEERAPGRFRVYNVGSDNQNFAEALWQAIYWFEIAPETPGALIVQSSFDTLRKTSVRAGYQTLLDEPRYAAALAAWIDRARPYAGDFRAAVHDHGERKAELAGKDETRWQTWSPEPSLRAAMDHVTLFHQREKLKSSLLGALYALRVRGLGISPTTRRHITGAPLEQNLAALADLVALARSKGAKVFVYNAPTNPAVDMFYADEYRSYLDRTMALCAAHGATFADFGHAVPAEHWGFWIDGPDPIHFDDEGHAIIHRLLTEEFAPLVLRR